jgi:HEAT repeat protein
LLNENSEELRLDAVAALTAIGVDAVPALVENLQSRDIAVCTSVCTVLQQIGAEAEDAVPALVALVADPDDSLRDAVFLTFAEIGPSTVGDMVRFLQHEDSGVRRRAAMVLSRMGPAAAPAMTALCDATCDPDANVRFWAVKALGETGHSANAALDNLIHASRDEDADVRWQAVVAMRKTGAGEPAKQAIFVLLNDPHSAVRTKAEAALANW